MQRIRDQYKVAWKRGDAIRYGYERGRIAGARQMRLVLILSGSKRVIAHPCDPGLFLDFWMRKGATDAK